jgi:four helix bundle protein
MTGTATIFDHEKLEVYQLQIQFVAWLGFLFEEIKDKKAPRIAETLDQLDRASVSQVLNTAEGNGRRATQQRARFFDDARGSANECAACLDILVAKAVCLPVRVAEGKAMLSRIVAMLTRLVGRFDMTAHDDIVESRTSSSRRTRTNY